MITSNSFSLYVQDELLSRKKREKKKRTGGKNIDEVKVGVEKNERWEHRRISSWNLSLFLLKC